MSSYGQQLLRAYVEEMLTTKATILEDYRPSWMCGLELDLYIPEIDVAFEFQGDQHFVPIQGEVGFAKQAARDSVKKQICLRRGTPLIQITAGDLGRQQLIRRISAYSGAYGRKGKHVRRLFKRSSPEQFSRLDLRVREYLRILSDRFGSVTTKKANARLLSGMVAKSIRAIRQKGANQDWAASCRRKKIIRKLAVEY